MLPAVMSRSNHAVFLLLLCYLACCCHASNRSDVPSVAEIIPRFLLSLPDLDDFRLKFIAEEESTARGIDVRCWRD